MSFLERLDEFLVGRITFPAVSYLLNRRDIPGRYRRLLASEYYSQEALRELQFAKLGALLRRVCASNAFYTARFQKIGLKPEDIRTLEDVRFIPPLVRDDILRHRVDLIDPRYRQGVAAADESSGKPGAPVSLARFRGRTLIRNTSSGSTGTPTVFYEDGSTAALNWVHELRLKRWFGLPPGVKEARMSATAMEYAARGDGPSPREILWNQMVLPGYFLSSREYEISLQKIRKFRPRVLWGPTSAFTGLARYLQSEGQTIAPCRPELVITRAAPLYDHEKQLLTEVFHCPVTNIYGSREVGHVAMTCPHGSIHVNEENYLVEVESEGPGRANAGTGRMLLTPLFETPMPFVRYDIGDLAQSGGAPCPCGRSLVTLTKILGRIGEVYYTREGHRIEPNFWCIVFEIGRAHV